MSSNVLYMGLKAYPEIFLAEYSKILQPAIYNINENNPPKPKRKLGDQWKNDAANDAKSLYKFRGSICVALELQPKPCTKK